MHLDQTLLKLFVFPKFEQNPKFICDNRLTNVVNFAQFHAADIRHFFQMRLIIGYSR